MIHRESSVKIHPPLMQFSVGKNPSKYALLQGLRPIVDKRDHLGRDRTRKCAVGVANAHLFIATVEFKVKMKFTIVTVHPNMCDTITYLMQYIQSKY